MKMPRLDSPPYAFWLLLSLVALTIWRLAAAWHGHVELYADEAQYWIWSLKPDWGYYSKPPVVAWAIYLGTHLFGDGEMGVRAAAALTYPATAWVLFLLVRRLFRQAPRGEAMAFWTGLIFATLPMTSLGSQLITTDALLLLFWSLALLCTASALETDRWRNWLGLGLAVGLGLLAKYSMVFFALGLVAYLLFSPTQRHRLRTPQPYVAAVVALLVVLPNIVWNANHQYISFQHTAEISQLDRSLFHPTAFFHFFLSQFAVFGPTLAAGLLWLALRPQPWRNDDRLRLLAAFSMAPLAAFLGLALLSRAFANWAAFAYAAGTALVVVAWLQRGHRGWVVATLILNLVAAVAIYHLHDLSATLGVQLSRKTDPYGRVTGHRALGLKVAEQLRAHPGARLLAEDRKLYALLRYYARPYSEGARFLNMGGRIGNHFALSENIKEAPSGEFLLVSRYGLDAHLPLWFVKVTPLPPIRLPLYPDYAPVYNVWLVKDYRGP